MREETRQYKPKECTYRGRKLRCKHEERFAIYLESSGVSWSYEPHAFPLRESEYTPDFFLYDLKMLVELKPADCLEETWKIHELSLLRTEYAYLIASMPEFELKLHEYGKMVEGEMRWFAADEIRWVYCRLCCHPYVFVNHPDWPSVSCTRCGFDAGESSFSDKQMASVLPVDRARRWRDENSEDPLFAERLLNKNYLLACRDNSSKKIQFDKF